MNAYADVRSVGIDIVFQLIDVNAAGNATADSTDKMPFSVPGEMLTGREKPRAKIATMEDGLVQTDGTWDIIPDGFSVPYWSSTLSGADGKFSTPPVVTFSLSAPASSVGFTLLFDDLAECWPKTVRIDAKKSDGSTIKAQTFTVTGPQLTADMPVANYSRVDVSFLETPVPYRRIRMYGFIFGITQRFDEDMIVTATFKSGCSVPCESIQSAQVDFVIDNSEKKYNMINPDGLFKFLQDGQAVETGITIDGQLVNTGKYYFTSSQAKDGALTAQITANDEVMAWGDDTYDGGKNGTWTLGAALRAVLGERYAFRFGPGVESRIVSRAIPAGTKKRKAVQWLCQAAMCSFWIDREGTAVCMALEIAEAGKDVFDSNNLENMDGVSVDGRYEKIVLTVRNSFAKTENTYTAGTGKAKSVENPCVAPQNGQAVADWLLSAYTQHLEYDLKNRGNPELLTGDTVTVYNAYDEASNAVIYDNVLKFNGGLEAKTKAMGRPFK